VNEWLLLAHFERKVTDLAVKCRTNDPVGAIGWTVEKDAGVEIAAAVIISRQLLAGGILQAKVGVEGRAFHVDLVLPAGLQVDGENLRWHIESGIKAVVEVKI